MAPTLLQGVLPRNVQTSLVAAQVVGFATLLRSVAWDRWITVLVSALLLLGASSALRGRSWGIALSLATAAFFPAAFLLGMAPIWFLAVGAVAAWPYLLTSRAFARADRSAATLLASLSISFGAGLAMSWKVFAWPLFMAFPAIRPSAQPGHGVLLTILLGVAAAVAVVRRRSSTRQAAAQLAPAPVAFRVEPRLRVSDMIQRDTHLDAHEEEIDAPRAKVHRT